MPPEKKQAAKISLHRGNVMDRQEPSKLNHSFDLGHSLSPEQRFDSAIRDYYVSKSLESDPASLDAIVDNALQSEKLAQKILAMPAMTPHQVLAKLSVLDAELLSDLDCEAPVERRHIVAFAALKVDIVRLLAEKKG